MNTTRNELGKSLQNAFLTMCGIAVTGLLLCSIFFMIAVNGNISTAVPISIAAVFIIASIFCGSTLIHKAVKAVDKKIEWHESVLDAIPFPLSITDNDRKWTFVNHAVEQMLGKSRESLMGQQCKNWGAGICGTDNCGLNCLNRNKLKTYFEQGGGDFQVDVRHLITKDNQKIGHIEIVQDITTIVETQKAQAALVSDIHQISDSFVIASKNMADASQLLAEGSTEQAAAVDELSRRIGIITEETVKTADMAKESAELSKSIMNTAIEGNEQMKRLSTAVSEINEANQAINNIIDAIDGIASQTNLLSLNAAIEAARAGSQGAGFTVVANQVRVLAGQSAESAGSSKKLIDNSIEKAKMGVDIAIDTSQYLQKIVDGIAKSAEMIDMISEYSNKQKGEIEEVKRRIEQVSDVVQQNSATSEESAATSQELNAQTDELNNMLNDFDKKVNK